MVYMPPIDPPIDHGRLDARPPEIAPTARSMIGAAVFGAMTVLIAHSPESWRALYTGPARLGPAIVDGRMGGGLRFVW